jgi:RNA polymerase sigma factor (sigma-70 family)
LSQDEQLIQLCKKNDRQAQKTLFTKYAPKMMGVCLRYSKNYDDAQDILQEGFIKIFKKIGTFEGKSSLATWMSRIFVHTAINSFRKAHLKHVHVDITDEYYAEKLSAKEDDSEQNESGLEQSAVLEAIQKLPDIYRVILNMYAIDGLSHNQIAKELEVSVGTSKSRLSRARVLLKERLNKK